MSALVEASQFTAYGQVGIDGSARGNKLTVKAKPFDSRLKFTGDDKKFVVKKIPPDPIGPVSAFPKLFVKPVKSSQQSLSDDVIGTAPAFKLEAGKNAVFKKGDELFKNTGPIPTEVKLFVPPKDPVKFNYRLKKTGRRRRHQGGDLLLPGSLFRRHGGGHQPEEEGRQDRALAPVHGWADRECEAADASAV